MQIEGADVARPPGAGSCRWSRAPSPTGRLQTLYGSALRSNTICGTSRVHARHQRAQTGLGSRKRAGSGPRGRARSKKRDLLRSRRLSRCGHFVGQIDVDPGLGRPDVPRCRRAGALERARAYAESHGHASTLEFLASSAIACMPVLGHSPCMRDPPPSLPRPAAVQPSPAPSSLV